MPINLSQLEQELLKVEEEELRLEEEEMHLDEASGGEAEFNRALEMLTLLGNAKSKAALDPEAYISVSGNLQRYILKQAKSNPAIWKEAKYAMETSFKGVLSIDDTEFSAEDKEI